MATLDIDGSTGSAAAAEMPRRMVPGLYAHYFAKAEGNVLGMRH